MRFGHNHGRSTSYQDDEIDNETWEIGTDLELVDISLQQDKAYYQDGKASYLLFR